MQYTSKFFIALKYNLNNVIHDSEKFKSVSVYLGIIIITGSVYIELIVLFYVQMLQWQSSE